VVEEFVRGTRVWIGRGGRGWFRAAGALVSRNTRRWGGYLVHVGVALAALGIVGTEFWQKEASGLLLPGEHLAIAGYRVTFQDHHIESTAHRDVSRLSLEVRDASDRFVARMAPERSFWRTAQQPVSEVAIYPTLAGDLYAVNEFVTEEGRAKVKMFWNPLLGFLWLGGFVMAAGTVLAFVPGRRPAMALDTDREAEPPARSGEEERAAS
jgi:cytochrome c-type biogenesis protein CcmF